MINMVILLFFAVPQFFVFHSRPDEADPGHQRPVLRDRLEPFVPDLEESRPVGGRTPPGSQGGQQRRWGTKCTRSGPCPAKVFS